jgi:hypothetical protein
LRSGICGVNEATSVTVLTDGDAGLRAIHQQVAPHADHILDWFHISMKFTNLQQLAKGINAIADGGVRRHALAEIDHAKWRIWNGLTERGIVRLTHLGQWAESRCFEHIPSLKKLADSMPDYGERYCAGQRISTGFVESAVNEIIAKRMVKKQQLKWNRHTVQRFLDVRIHVLMGLWKMHSVIGTKASGLSPTKCSWLSQHDQPTTLHTLPIALQNKRLIYNLLFHTSAETLFEVARNPGRKQINHDIARLSIYMDNETQETIPAGAGCDKSLFSSELNVKNVRKMKNASCKNL